MEILKNNSWSLTSNNIQIINNIIHKVDERAFNSIMGLDSKSEVNKARTINFTNNIIYSFAPGALSVTPRSQKNIDGLIVSNNQIACNCDNIYWFDSVVKMKKDVQHYLFYYSYYHKWFKEDSQNICLYIPNCSIGQVMNNYLELCEENYNCSETTQADGDDVRKLKDPGHVLKNLINYNHDVNVNISNLLQDLTDRIGNKTLKNFINSSSSKIEKKMRNYSIFLVKNVYEKQKEISNLPYENTIVICIFVIAIVLGLALGFLLLIKCIELPFLKPLAVKYGVTSNNGTIKTNKNWSLTQLVENI